MISKIFQLFLKPFKQNLLFLIITFLCSSIMECIGFAVFESLPKSIFLALHHFIYSYFIVFLYGLLPQVVQRFYKGIVILLLVINYIIDTICVYSFNFTFDQEIPAVIFGTNSNEASEFLDSFLSIKLFLLIIIGVSLIMYSFYWVKRKELCVPKYFPFVGFVGVILSLFLTTVAVDSKNWVNVSVGKFVCFARVWKSADVTLAKNNPILVSTGDKRAKNIVLIIGESFAKSHSSLYGYDKPTNPLLEKMKQEGELFVFQHAEAPALKTIPSFKCMMSTFEAAWEDTVAWYTCTTLPEVLNKAHYKSFWISNQAQKGANDNIVSKYAELFDKAYFTGNRFAAKGKADMDETVLDILPEYMQQRDSLSLCVFHLLGSHPKFECRYPETFNKFTADDYQNKPENQRQNLAAYDNSVLYNDYVVSEIMHHFQNEEAIVFYFPDHGLDVYESRENYAGHASWNNPISLNAGKQIPFMIYCTPSFVEKNASIMDNIKVSLEKHFYTENMIYTIMDLANYQIKGQPFDKDRCLLID